MHKFYMSTVFPVVLVTDQKTTQPGNRSAGQPVVQVAGGLGVLQQHLGDIVQILLVCQPVAAVHVITVSQQALHVGGDAAGGAIQP